MGLNAFFLYDKITGKDQSDERRREVEEAEDFIIENGAAFAGEEVVGNIAGAIGAAAGPAGAIGARFAGSLAGAAAGKAAGHAAVEFRRRNR